MKLSVSMPDRDVEFLDEYVKRRQLPSRSAAVQEAIHQLRTSGLGDDYAAAWAEWAESDDADLWECTVGDGIGG